MTSFVMGQLLSMWRDRRHLAHAGHLAHVGPGSHDLVFAPTQDLGMVKQVQDPYLAGYRLGSRLGKGTFGVVHRGFRKDSGASCAIKIINIDAQDATGRFRREAHLLSKLHHESIVPLLEYFPPSPAFQREEAVLVFPEREGDLRRFIERRRADACVSDLTGPAVARFRIESWACQLASGLA